MSYNCKDSLSENLKLHKFKDAMRISLSLTFLYLLYKNTSTRFQNYV